MPNKKSLPISQHIGKYVFLTLCVIIPLILHTDVYQYALLPKRMVLLLGLFLISLLWLADIHSKQISFKKSPFYLPLFCYLIFVILSAIQAPNTLAAVVEITHQVTFICLFMLTYHLFPLQALPTFFRLCAIVGILVSILGILEARGINANWFPTSNGRPSATFAYRNFAAAYLIMSLPLTILLWVRAQKSTDILLGAFATTLMSVFLIYTRTRGAWVGFTCAVLLVILLALVAHLRWKTPFGFSSKAWKHNTNKAISGFAVILMFILAALPPQIASQHSRAIDEKKVGLMDALNFVATPQADRGRRLMWQHTLEMIQDHPILGVGVGNWQYIYPRYDKGDMLRADSAPERPHNDWLEIASETGILTLIIYIWVLTTIARVIILVLRNTKNPEHNLYTLAIAVSLLAVLGHGQVSFPQERIETSWLFWFGLGILAHISTLSSPLPKTNAPYSQPMAYLVPMFLLGSIALTYYQIKFDHHYLKAFEFYKGGNTTGLLNASSTALKYCAFNSQIYLLQGNAYRATGLFSQAQNAYQTGLQYHPNSPQLLKALGTAYALQRKFDQAEKQYQAALDIYPFYQQVYNDLGNVYQERGFYPQAIAAYRNAGPGSDPDIQRNLALTLVAADSTIEAISIYRNLLKSQPNDVSLLYDLGEAFLKQASKDPKAFIQARVAFTHFIKRWNGDSKYTQEAQKQLQKIQKNQGTITP
ncbi:MAG: O-antigen ligase/Flp pilus assembly protein TadD [Candidatus Latescibacterota bacterium]|jgi:O-antigen ligase/Flp pilus assembly protein TadD